MLYPKKRKKYSSKINLHNPCHLSTETRVLISPFLWPESSRFLMCFKRAIPLINSNTLLHMLQFKSLKSHRLPNERTCI